MAPLALHIGASPINAVNGLYSLNDLHKAAGGEKRHQPAHFLATQQTRDLISEISNLGNPGIETRRGAAGGTYACRELVIAYAAWISAAFHLKVIRVFLDQAAPMSARHDYARISNAQYRELCQAIHGVVAGWLFSDGSRQAVYNHIRVAFGVARFEDLPADNFEAALALIHSKRKAVSQALEFATEFCDWFNRECLGGGAPWTPAIVRRLTRERGERIQIPPRVDWLALADKTKGA